MRRIVLSAFVSLVFLALSQPGLAQQADKQGKIDNALSAAPAKIAQGAAVMDGEQNSLREGSNGWTCFPDRPNSPGNDPMCLDAQWLKWAEGLSTKTKPQVSGVGLAYMLAGGADASNTDPFATEPAPGDEWVKAGPHIMVIVPDPAMLGSLPTDPNNGGPWVMWKGTPYAHVMMPVAAGEHAAHGM